MLKFSLLLLSSLACVLSAADQAGDRWRPSEHPTVISRTIPGYTRPRRSLDLWAEFGGRISGFRATEGEHLFVPVASEKTKNDSGDWLVALDDTFESLAVEAAKARLDMAKAEFDIATARRNEAERTKQYLQGALTREQKLKEKDSSSEEAVELAKHRSDVAALDVKKAEADIGRTNGQLSQATADHKSAKEKQSRCRLRVPATEQREIDRLTALFPELNVEKDRLIDWVVERREVEAGTQVAPGQGILSLADVGLLKIELRLDVGELSALEAAMQRNKHIPITFTTNGKIVRSVLARRDFEYDPVSRKRLVELWLPGSAAPEATGGLPVELTLEMRSADNAFALPEKFISTRTQLDFVKLSDGREIRVSVLRRQGDRVFISSEGIPADAEFIAYGPK